MWHWIVLWLVGLGWGAWGAVKLYRRLRGKKLAILGERGVGKTTLLRFLSGDPVSEGEVPGTQAPTKVKGRWLKDLKLQLLECVDLPGTPHHLADWKKAVESADLVLYLARADLLARRSAETEERIDRDLQHVQSWLEKHPKHLPSLFIGNFCDLDPTYGDEASERTAYRDAFNKLKSVEDAILRLGGRGRARVVVGSMKTQSSTQILVSDLFKEVLS